MSLRPARDLSRARVQNIPQPLLMEGFVPLGHVSLSVGTLPRTSTAALSENLLHPSGVYVPRESIVIPRTHSMGIYGDYIYARTSVSGSDHRIHIIERTLEPRFTVVDSFDVNGWVQAALIVAGRFLIADHEVFDLADPLRPALIGELNRSSFRIKARPHPTLPDAQLIASTSDGLGDGWPDSLYLWRVSPSGGFAREWGGPTPYPIDFVEFDDSRDLLYFGGIGGGPVRVYDVSDPPATTLLHDFWYYDAIGRSLWGFGVTRGILHIADKSPGLLSSGHDFFRLRPWWWNGEAFVPLGPGMEHSLYTPPMYGEDDRLIFPNDVGAEIRYTRPDPLGTDVACTGPPPFGPR
ncbi:MAG: hypothetical protein CME06_07565 [Gemmatimonadetes bacterium]|nr:hypothetical protein [Gemmatimonadota bacterium]